MKIFKNAWFERFSRKHRISYKALFEAVQRADKGQIDANLGGGVIKQRVSRHGQGKSAGFRTIILYRTAERAFFVYGFAKNDRDNITDNEEAQFKKAATYVLGLSDVKLAELLSIGQLSEVTDDG
ncbi:type II toxin-antitoxin system RelE/ParE family toxin [Nitrincola alkalilacustris]|uniref:type II toxin-antitoxin system RelE/ParE family toxin n=1 Tax=Nitrincola alkalilacustris TaxID=1571224 RepID=UPI00124DDE15|nr:type II toxin-antitoxin system RelE/ParE family toxin [Nitrincola alkalilacustris]